MTTVAACAHGQRPYGRAVSIKPSFLELNASTHLINLDRSNNVSSHGRAVQVDSIKTRGESAYTYRRGQCQ